MFRRTAALGLIISLGLAGQAAAQAKSAITAQDVDLRCMLVASALSQNKEPAARGLSNIMVFYYMGRLDVRSPGLALGPALQAEAQKSPPAEMQAQGQKCIATMKARAGALQALSGPRPNAPPAQAAPPAAMPTGPASPQ